MPKSIRQRLAVRFFDRLAAEEPSSVLDVGCGLGDLLVRCRDAGITAHGIEPGEALVADLREQELAVTVGRAEELPFRDRSFDWVTIRHVSHHLADERPAMNEALRVARRGVLVAEPWLDESIPSQRVALRFDRWLEEQNTRVGHVHRAALSAGDFLAAVPENVDASVQIDHLLILEARPEGWMAAEAAPFLEDLAPEDPAGMDYASIVFAAERDGLTHNGTMILALRL